MPTFSFSTQKKLLMRKILTRDLKNDELNNSQKNKFISKSKTSFNIFLTNQTNVGKLDEYGQSNCKDSSNNH